MVGDGDDGPSDLRQGADRPRQREKLYRSLVENVLDGYFVCEVPTGKVLFLNQGFCGLLGCTMEEGLDLSIWDVISPQDIEHVRRRFQMPSSRNRLLPERRTYGIMRKDGSTFRAEVSATSVTFQGARAVQGVLRDVTQREHYQRQVLQAQRMEAIGELAGGITHDFNNLLMGVQGNISLMLLETGKSTPFYAYLKNIEEHVQRGAGLTKQLLSFARGEEYVTKPVDINRVIMAGSEMFSRTRKEIALHTRYQEDVWTVDVDQVQIEQVLLNMYVNACDAMPGGGELHIDTANVSVDGEGSKLYKVARGRYVKISIRDNGIGMDEETQKRVFEPFFSTKEKDKGTGLGLFSAYNIIRNHRGTIVLTSEVGVGTVVNVYLPAAMGMPAAEAAAPRAVIRGSESILFIDDEAQIIDVGARMLKSLGYRVLTARNCEQAIGIYGKDPDAIDMVILDVIMPAMESKEIYEKLKTINPEVTILLASGSDASNPAIAFFNAGYDGFIAKPFTMHELSEKLREILDK